MIHVMAGKQIAYADVILPLALPKLFTYEAEEKWLDKITPGVRAIVQFGKRKYYSAIVRNIHNNKPQGYTLKKILTLLDENPLISTNQLSFWEWMADYYMCTMGEVYKAALPSGLKLESETWIMPNPIVKPSIELNEKEKLLLAIVENHLKVRIDKLPVLTGVKSNLPVVKSLLEKKAITLQENLKESYKPKYEKYIALNKEFTSDKFNRIFASLEKAPRQLKIVMAFIQLTNHHPQKTKASIPQKELLTQANATSQMLKTLIDKKIFTSIEKEVERIELEEGPIMELPDLNSAQNDAYKQIIQLFKHKDVILLHGVTSSGKTEIYMKLIKNQIDQGKEVLYLLPEIALTTQIISRLRKVFGKKIGVYHSKFTDAERVEIWNNILKKTGKEKYQIILGVRSSVFLPFHNLGLVIVDEEHENTYKQFDPAPRYHARDAAIYLAGLHGCKTVLGTATPSIETYYNAKNDKFGLVNLMERYTKVEMPKIHIVNTREAYKKKKMQSHFSPQLLDGIESAIAENEQVILFQNRRGFSPFIQCAVCAWIPYCSNCNVSLTYHKHLNRLVCHYCGHSIQVVKTCHACGSPSLQTKGFGTEKIEDEIKLFFPEVRVTRLDLDAVRSRKTYEKIIEDFEKGKIDILIGTQMISKGLDFNNVMLVGILNADNMLNFPDFRAFERSYQLMAQVSGRAGRMKKRGNVIIQTSDPSHPIIKDVCNNNFIHMYSTQLADRRTFNYPPFYRLIQLTLKHKQKSLLNKAAHEFGIQLQNVFGDRVIGPEFPPVDKIQKWYIKQILIKIEKEKSAQKAKAIIKSLLFNIKSKENYRSLQIIPDVDPM